MNATLSAFDEPIQIATGLNCRCSIEVWSRVAFCEVVENVNDTESNPGREGVERLIGFDAVSVPLGEFLSARGRDIRWFALAAHQFGGVSLTLSSTSPPRPAAPHRGDPLRGG